MARIDEQPGRYICRALPGDGGNHGSPAALTIAEAELRSLEEERDTAVAAAENLAKAATKLDDMVQMMEKMALEKVKEGDEEGAKQVLLEKRSTQEVLETTSGKAQANFSLAAKLAHKIGEKQKEVLELSKLALEPEAGPASGAGYSSGFDYGGQASRQQQQQQPGSWGLPDDSLGFGKARWQVSFEDAKQHMRAAQRDAEQVGYAARQAAAQAAEQAGYAARQAAGQAAEQAGYAARQAAEQASRTAERGAEDARRAAERGAEDAKWAAEQAGARLKYGADDSIRQAQDRLRMQEADTMAYVNGIIARYRRGEYVAQKDLDFAFEQLEKRSKM